MWKFPIQGIDKTQKMYKCLLSFGLEDFVLWGQKVYRLILSKPSFKNREYEEKEHLYTALI